MELPDWDKCIQKPVVLRRSMAIWAIMGIVRLLSFFFIVPTDCLYVLACGLFACHHVVLLACMFSLCHCAFRGTVSTLVRESLPRLRGWVWRLVIQGSISASVQDQHNCNTKCKSSQICFWECCGLPSVLASCEKVIFWMKLILTDCEFDLTLLKLAEAFGKTDLM